MKYSIYVAALQAAFIVSILPRAMPWAVAIPGQRPEIFFMHYLE